MQLPKPQESGFLRMQYITIDSGSFFEKGEFL